MMSVLKKLKGREIEEYFGAIVVTALIAGRVGYVTHQKKTMKSKTYKMFAEPQTLVDLAVKKLLIERKDIETDITNSAHRYQYLLVHGPESKY